MLRRASTIDVCDALHAGMKELARPMVSATEKQTAVTKGPRERLLICGKETGAWRRRSLTTLF